MESVGGVGCVREGENAGVVGSLKGLEVYMGLYCL